MGEAAAKPSVKADATSAPIGKVFEWQPFEGLRSQVDRLFQNFEGSLSRSPFYQDVNHIFSRDADSHVMPAIDLVEKNDAFELTAELPGLDINNIELSFSNDTLTLKGEKTAHTEDKSSDRYVSERSYGAFRRQLQLPVSINAGKIDADFKNGILTVRLPKSTDAFKKPTTIVISPK